jgi:hypothetical protein
MQWRMKQAAEEKGKQEWKTLATDAGIVRQDPIREIRDQGDIIMEQDATYPSVRFLVRYGAYLSAFLGLMPLAGAIVAVFNGWAWQLILGAIAVGALVWLFVFSYVEVLRIIEDTLLPK